MTSDLGGALAVEDSAQEPLQPQVSGDGKPLEAALLEELADLENELKAIPEPQEEDYKVAAEFELAKRVYRAEIRSTWEKIHKLMRRWPPAV